LVFHSLLLACINTPWIFADEGADSRHWFIGGLEASSRSVLWASGCLVGQSSGSMAAHYVDEAHFQLLVVQGVEFELLRMTVEYISHLFPNIFEYNHTLLLHIYHAYMWVYMSNTAFF
jgi:hypothetical protein